MWIYARIPQVTITGPTDTYTHGDRELAFHSCKICGCITHWENLALEGPDARMAVNLRLADPDVMASVPVRYFDGADSWRFVDAPLAGHAQQQAYQADT
ncbi:hypothetical protein [Yoonia sp. SS1-5]|uniref:CENP-V/GFA domain-containing protein n=1 Tax=Yoonia rhodophyticola TaxID=3137370 RepID=A0AAN0NM70_9RHOB